MHVASVGRSKHLARKAIGMTTVIEEKDIPTVVEEKKLLLQDAGVRNQKSPSKNYDGRIVSMIGDKLVMSSKEGTEYSHTLAADAKLTCDGQVCKSENLKPGHKVRVTTKKDERNVVIGIESLNKNAEFAQCCS